MSFNERTLMVFNENDYNKITDNHILIAGVGGVGGAVLECLVRFGIKKISIIDFDTVDVSNLNRQIISNTKNIGELKTKVSKERALLINPNIQINTYNTFLTKDNLDFILDLKPDYIIDAIDNVTAKIALINLAHNNNLNIISSMGTGNRFSVNGFTIDSIEKTSGNGCGLSRVLRKELKKQGIVNHTCLFNTFPSKTKAVNSSFGRNAPGSTPFAPNIAGIMIAQYVCEELLNI